MHVGGWNDEEWVVEMQGKARNTCEDVGISQGEVHGNDACLLVKMCWLHVCGWMGCKGGCKVEWLNVHVGWNARWMNNECMCWWNYIWKAEMWRGCTAWMFWCVNGYCFACEVCCECMWVKWLKGVEDGWMMDEWNEMCMDGFGMEKGVNVHGTKVWMIYECMWVNDLWCNDEEWIKNACRVS